LSLLRIRVARDVIADMNGAVEDQHEAGDEFFHHALQAQPQADAEGAREHGER
jgi:hypothetical protein